MFKNHFITAWRNIIKQKFFAVINISGLSIGIACFSLLALYAYNEFSFDKFNKNAGNIYRPYVWFDALNGQPAAGYMDYSGPTATTLGEALKQDLPDVINYVRIQLPYDKSLLRANNKGLRAEVTYADPSLFSVFSFPLKYGNAASALRNLNDVVLTESKAKELFGTDDIVGKIIEIKIGATFQPFTISAVSKDIPENSTIHFDILGNFLYAEKYVNGSIFVGNDFHYIDKQTYVQLRPGSTLANDKKQLQNFLATFYPGYLTDLKNSGATWPKNEIPVNLKLQPLLSIHTSDINLWHDFPHVDLKSIWILLAIAFGILLIASINFTTLAIGRSAGRSKEIGVRKVIGADKRQLIFQFITEAFLLSIVSAIIGLLLANLLLPYFNQLAKSDLHFSLSPQIFFLFVSLVIIVGLIAGSYPAFVLSSFKPILILKNKIRVGGSNLFTRSLVTFQFVLSIVLIVSTIIMLQQTQYLLNKNPGFNKENVIVVDASESDPAKIFPLFKQSIINQRSIENVASAAAGLGAGQNYLGYSDNGLNADINIIDTNYLSVLDLKLIAGKNFNAANINDTVKSIIINETMMKAFGWNTENAVGKEIKNFQGQNAVVTGVVKNFSYHSLSEVVKNQAFITSKDKGYANFYVRVKPGDPTAAIAAMQNEWNSLLPGIPMRYSFLDDDINNYYKAEQKWASIVGCASSISIFLACLGLLGLAALASINRVKEIGVRKVLGASIPDILALLSKDFIKLIIVSFLIASPLAWYFMNNWLLDYANHIHINWIVFLITGIAAITIAFITISFQALKAAVANPVKSLRTE
ncbi:FtsX-like permease family protein [Ginsengibacter hankyongi]|uniref:FtsX-like permease family protein n=1 Tax=Ginsengibacter hankyongi TaxID=2607284 RepID=A0A5J5IIZ3_9BACT|nr:ABC transporter permease [Ginsengibacter hankyongi]KAA9041000.1 FtsX-like permease family protein [Ginsengibacter hankyongi]